MGDRANIAVSDGKGRVYLYTHWNGTELPETLQRALARRQRWDDAFYLTRIIFCEMVKGQETEETGFGISTYVGDGENRVLVVDPDNGTVTRTGGGKIFSFAEYLALTNPTWSKLGETE